MTEETGVKFRSPRVEDFMKDETIDQDHNFMYEEGEKNPSVKQWKRRKTR